MPTAGTFLIIPVHSGEAGWGDLFERDPTLVLRNVGDGVVSRKAAERLHSIVLTADGRSVDVAGTRASRAAGIVARQWFM